MVVFDSQQKYEDVKEIASECKQILKVNLGKTKNFAILDFRDKDFWTALHNPSSQSCSDAGCDGKLV